MIGGDNATASVSSVTFRLFIPRHNSQTIAGTNTNTSPALLPPWRPIGWFDAAAADADGAQSKSQVIFSLFQTRNVFLVHFSRSSPKIVPNKCDLFYQTDETCVSLAEEVPYTLTGCASLVRRRFGLGSATATMHVCLCCLVCLCVSGHTVGLATFLLLGASRTRMHEYVVLTANVSLFGLAISLVLTSSCE